MAAPVLVDPAQYRRTPWKNGGGVTIDIAQAYRGGAMPGAWDGMLWRFGRTRIERPGPFSDLSGYERLLAVIEGNGLLLHAEGRPVLDVRQPFTPVRFDGAWPIRSDPTQGPVGVLNLMADRDGYSIELRFPGEGARATLPPGQAIILALEAAALRIDGVAVSLRPEWSCVLQPHRPTALDHGTGRIAVATIAPRTNAANGGP